MLLLLTLQLAHQRLWRALRGQGAPQGLVRKSISPISIESKKIRFLDAAQSFFAANFFRLWVFKCDVKGVLLAWIVTFILY